MSAGEMEQPPELEEFLNGPLGKRIQLPEEWSGQAPRLGTYGSITTAIDVLRLAEKEYGVINPVRLQTGWGEVRPDIGVRDSRM